MNENELIPTDFKTFNLVLFLMRVLGLLPPYGLQQIILASQQLEDLTPNKKKNIFLPGPNVFNQFSRWSRLFQEIVSTVMAKEDCNSVSICSVLVQKVVHNLGVFHQFSSSNEIDE